jgi:periplasmic protein TonB
MRWLPDIARRGEVLAVGASVLLHGAAFAAILAAGSRAAPIMPDGLAIPVVWEASVAAEPAMAAPPVPAAPATPPVAETRAPVSAPKAVERAVRVAAPVMLPRREPTQRLAQRQVAEAPAPAPVKNETASEEPAAGPSGDVAPVAESRPAPESQPQAVPATSSSQAAPSSSQLAAVPAGRATGWSVLVRNPPKYPPAARRRGLEGEVILLAEVGTDGAVEAVSLLRSSGYPELDDAAMTAVEKWRFRAPSRLSIQIPITFRLDND